MRNALKNRGTEDLVPATGLEDEALPPVTVSADVLLGTMPKADAAIKDQILEKLTSKHEWKPMRIVLTDRTLYLARHDEEILRDLIPLMEITKVLKSVHIDKTISHDRSADLTKSSLLASRSLHATSIGALFDSQSEGDLFVMEIHTVEGGYNSGRSYHFRIPSEADCDAWIAAVRAACSHAALHGGPTRLAVLRGRMRALYQHDALQAAVAVLIFSCFLANVAQTELLSASQPPPGSPFAILEVVFCAAFAAELLLNVAANFPLPFSSDPWNWCGAPGGGRPRHTAHARGGPPHASESPSHMAPIARRRCRSERAEPAR